MSYFILCMTGVTNASFHVGSARQLLRTFLAEGNVLTDETVAVVNPSRNGLSKMEILYFLAGAVSGKASSMLCQQALMLFIAVWLAAMLLSALKLCPDFLWTFFISHAVVIFVVVVNCLSSIRRGYVIKLYFKPASELLVRGTKH